MEADERIYLNNQLQTQLEFKILYIDIKDLINELLN